MPRPSPEEINDFLRNQHGARPRKPPSGSRARRRIAKIPAPSWRAGAFWLSAGLRFCRRVPPSLSSLTIAMQRRS